MRNQLVQSNYWKLLEYLKCNVAWALYGVKEDSGTRRIGLGISTLLSKSGGRWKSTGEPTVSLKMASTSGSTSASDWRTPISISLFGISGLNWMVCLWESWNRMRLLALLKNVQPIYEKTPLWVRRGSLLAKIALLIHCHWTYSNADMGWIR